MTVESLGDGVAATDARGRIDLFNPVAQRLTGWSWPEARGQPLEAVLRILDEDTGLLIEGRLHRVLDEGVTLGLPAHAAIWARDDGMHPIADSIAPIRDRRGAVLGAVCVFRDLTRERTLEQQLRDLARRVEAIRESDRTRIARELHDELGQQLTAIHLDLAWLGPRLRGVGPEVSERVEALEALVDGTFAMVRRLATELRPQILDELGLVPALEWLAAESATRSGLKVVVDASPDAVLLAGPISTAVFRIAQEALTNVVRHAEAHTATLRLLVEPGLVTFQVIDDGRGIRTTASDHPPSLGLLGMSERVTLSGGTLQIRETPGGGTTVVITLPREPTP